jgi:hypothetical protein
MIQSSSINRRISCSQLVIACILCLLHWDGKCCYAAVGATSCTLCYGTEEIPNPDDAALVDGTKCVYVAIDAIFSSQSHTICDSYYRYVGYTKCGCAAAGETIVDTTTTTTTTDNSGNISNEIPSCSICSDGREMTLPNETFDSFIGTTCIEAESYLQKFSVSDEACTLFQNKANGKCGCVNKISDTETNEPTSSPTSTPTPNPSKQIFSTTSFNEPTCQDDPNFRFVINAQTGRSVPCSWIDDGYKLEDVLFRREAQCFKSNVANACKRACGECCGDNKKHTFQHLDNQGNISWVNCEWLSTRPFWKDFYCEWKKGSCPETCGVCPNIRVPVPTNAPVTKSPTLKPSPNPTLRPTSKPTKGPSKSPSSRPTSRPTVAPTLSPTSIPTILSSERPSSKTLTPTKTKITKTNAPTIMKSNPPSKEIPKPTLSPTISSTENKECTSISSGIKPPLPPDVNTFEMVYSLDVTIGELVVMEDIIFGLESALTNTVSRAVLCPDQNQDYMTLLSQLDDRKIHYVQFTDLKKKSESKFDFYYKIC